MIATFDVITEHGTGSEADVGGHRGSARVRRSGSRSPFPLLVGNVPRASGARSGGHSSAELRSRLICARPPGADDGIRRALDRRDPGRAAPDNASPAVIRALFFQIYDMWRYGGSVMPALFGTAFVLWTALGRHMLSLQRGDKRAPRARAHLQRDPAAPVRHRGRGRAARRGAHRHHGTVPVPFWTGVRRPETRLHSGTTLVRCLIAMSPLMGLLGTVTGLIRPSARSAVDDLDGVQGIASRDRGEALYATDGTRDRRAGLPWAGSSTTRQNLARPQGPQGDLLRLADPGGR
jgi:biopolymer transport protein ExbB/TolQ